MISPSQSSPPLSPHGRSYAAVVAHASVPTGDASPIGNRRLSYEEASSLSKRRAILHATPSKGGESPVKKWSRTSAPTSSSSARQRRPSSFDPVASSSKRPSPSSIIPPDVPTAPALSSTNTSQPTAQKKKRQPRGKHSVLRSRAGATDTTKRSTSKVTPKPKPKPSKPQSKDSIAKNKKAIINNFVHKFARPRIFTNKIMHDDGFKTWEKWFSKQVRESTKRRLTNTTQSNSVSDHLSKQQSTYSILLP
mmetsp:Transcript_14298/g.30449  ORF Transcript_14298/g.30449 Transcript_14298/m.30449 type:complete len:250 (-) Transcript_14298:202-951(-)